MENSIIIKQSIFLATLVMLSPTLSVVKSLREQALYAYFSSRSLSAIKADLKHNKLTQEIQEALVPLIIKKYRHQLDRQFNKILKGHTDHITSVVFSHDSNYALTGSLDQTARLWDLSTGQTIKILQGHTLDILSIALSPDGRYALTGSEDKTARLWDLSTGQTIQILQGQHIRSIESVTFSPDGQYALTGSRDKKARLWDLATGQIMHTLQGHNDWVNSVAFSPDGHYALTGSDDYTARLWDLETGQAMRTLSHTHSVTAAIFSFDGKYALTGSSDSKVLLWDITDATVEPKVLHNHDNHVDSIVVFSHNGRYALTELYDRTKARLLWDLVHPEAKPVDLKGHFGYAGSAALSPDGQYALTGFWDKTVYLWDLRYCTENINLETFINKINHLAIEAPCTIV